ncbi:MAG: PLDc N-terminal domain-containing protein [Jatrophihabitantaceae bacterium]
MVLFDGFFGLLMLGVWIFCIIDVITTPAPQCRNLPKILWLLIVLLLAAVGSIVWLVAGRPWVPRAEAGDRSARHPSRRGAATNPDDDEEFLASLRARAEEQRRNIGKGEPEDGAPG